MIVVTAWVCSEVTGSAVRWPRVILMGDSLTGLSFRVSGQWGALVADRLTERPKHRQGGIADVINRGYGGNTSADYLALLEDVMSGEKGENVAAVTLMLGTNDVGKAVPLEGYRPNMLNILMKLMNEWGIPHDRLILFCPPPTDHTKKKYDTLALKPIVLSLGNDLNVTVVNLYDIFENDPRKSALYKDGVHFSPLGSQLVFNSVMPVIQQKVDEYRNQTSTRVN